MRKNCRGESEGIKFPISKNWSRREALEMSDLVKNHFSTPLEQNEFFSAK